MIYSKIRQEYFIPQIRHSSYNYPEGEFHQYYLFDNKIPIGYVNLIDKPSGQEISMIKNYNPEAYKCFETTADQIEVEHCLKRGIAPENIKINSMAALNSHAYHLKIGKVFKELPDGPFKKYLAETYGTADVNVIVRLILDKVKHIKDCHTEFLGKVPMFMPQELIKKYVEIIRKTPLLK